MSRCFYVFTWLNFNMLWIFQCISIHNLFGVFTSPHMKTLTDSLPDVFPFQLKLFLLISHKVFTCWFKCIPYNLFQNGGPKPIFSVLKVMSNSQMLSLHLVTEVLLSPSFYSQVQFHLLWITCVFKIYRESLSSCTSAPLSHSWRHPWTGLPSPFNNQPLLAQSC